MTSIERKAIAKLRMAGASRDAICEATGRCADSVSAALKHPETVALMARLGEQYNERLAKLYGKILDAVEQDLDSEVAYLRCQAQDRGLRLIEASDKARGLVARQAAPEQAAQGQFTLTEVLMVLRQVQAPAAGYASGAAGGRAEIGGRDGTA